MRHGISTVNTNFRLVICQSECIEIIIKVLSIYFYFVKNKFVNHVFCSIYSCGFVETDIYKLWFKYYITFLAQSRMFLTSNSRVSGLIPIRIISV